MQNFIVMSRAQFTIVSFLYRPWSLEERPWLRLVTWAPVPQIFPQGWSQGMTFVDLNWLERESIADHRYVKPQTGKYTFENPQTYSKLHTSQTKSIYIYLAYWSVTIISILAGRITEKPKTVSLAHVAWINLTAHCSLYKAVFYSP